MTNIGPTIDLGMMSRDWLERAVAAYREEFLTACAQMSMTEQEAHDCLDDFEREALA